MTFRGKVAFLVVAVAAAVLPASASAGDQLWWSNYGAGVPRVNPASGTGVNVFTGAPAVSGPYGTAADAARGKLFWINYDNRRIYSGNLDGSGTPEAVLTTNILTPFGLASDPTRGQLFWAERAARKIWRVGMDGSDPTALFTDSANVVSPIVEPVAGRVYWNRATLPRTIGYGSVDGGTIGTISIPADCPFNAADAADSFSIDAERGYIYIASAGSSTGISRMRMDGTGCTAVTSTSQTPFGMALDPDAQRLYWADYFNSQLRYVDLSPAGSEQTLAHTGAAVSSPAYPVLIKPPAGSASVSPASAETRETLRCSATWSQGAVGISMYRAPQNATYAWKLDGQTIAGADSSTVTADRAGSYECTVTGTNAAGSTAASSSPVAVSDPAPAPEPPTPPIPPIPPLPPLPPFTVKADGASATSLRTRVTVPGPGRLEQQGLLATGTRRSAATSACRGSRTVNAAGTYTLSCRTSAATRRARMRGKVRIVLRTSFTPTGGSTASSSRIVTLPALKPRFTG